MSSSVVHLLVGDDENYDYGARSSTSLISTDLAIWQHWNGFINKTYFHDALSIPPAYQQAQSSKYESCIQHQLQQQYFAHLMTLQRQTAMLCHQFPTSEYSLQVDAYNETLTAAQEHTSQKSPTPTICWHYNPYNEIFSVKVFVGGLPTDVTEFELNSTFSNFGPLLVDWPHKADEQSCHPPKGYVFLIFEKETSVKLLVEKCQGEEDELFLLFDGQGPARSKEVQIRPWRLADAEYMVDPDLQLDPRMTVFVGGVPRPLKAIELALALDDLYGGVIYAGIDTDPALNYPKGAARVTFDNHWSFMASISARYLHTEDAKRMELKPYVLDEHECDECEGMSRSGLEQQWFCPSIACLQYYCPSCWKAMHSQPPYDKHRPLIKNGVSQTNLT